MRNVDEGPTKKGWSWGRRAFAVGFVLFVGAWGWAFWYGAHRPKPEPLDPASERSAISVCRSAIVDLRALPQVGGAPTVAIRAHLITAENMILGRVVSGLDSIKPTDHSGAEALTAFAADWQRLITARIRYVHELAATGKRPKMYIPVANGEPVTIRMGDYADIHHLELCSPDSLQGEVVEGLRTYPRVG
jgi:hypothetical protein